MSSKDVSAACLCSSASAICTCLLKRWPGCFCIESPKASSFSTAISHGPTRCLLFPGQQWASASHQARRGGGSGVGLCFARRGSFDAPEVLGNRFGAFHLRQHRASGLSFLARAETCSKGGGIRGSIFQSEGGSGAKGAAAECMTQRIMRTLVLSLLIDVVTLLNGCGPEHRPRPLLRTNIRICSQATSCWRRLWQMKSTKATAAVIEHVHDPEDAKR